MAKPTPGAPTAESFDPIKVVGECHEWQGLRNNHGYGRVSVLGWPVYLHRLIYQAAHGLIPDGLHVLHRCDNPSCIRPEHLFLGTHRDNMADMVTKGRGGACPPERQARGSRQGLSKLTEADVRAIRTEYAASGTTRAELARRYDVHPRTIGRVLTGFTWGHVR